MIDLNATFDQLAPKLSRVINEKFPDKCSISRPSFSVTAYKTSVPSYSTIASGIGCSWAPAGKGTMQYVRALKLNAATAYAVTLPAQVDGVALDIKPKDRIVIAANSTEPQRTFEVAGPPLRNAGLSLFVLCTREE